MEQVAAGGNVVDEQDRLEQLYAFVGPEKKEQLLVKRAKGHGMFEKLCAAVKSGSATFQQAHDGTMLMRFTRDAYLALSNNDRRTAETVLKVVLVNDEGEPLTLHPLQYAKQAFLFWRCTSPGRDAWLAWQERNKKRSDESKAAEKAATEAVDVSPPAAVVFNRAHYGLCGEYTAERNVLQNALRPAPPVAGERIPPQPPGREAQEIPLESGPIAGEAANLLDEMKRYADQLQGDRCELKGDERLAERTCFLTPDQMRAVKYGAIGHDLKQEVVLGNALIREFGTDENGKVKRKFSPFASYVLSPANEIIAGPFSALDATTEAAKVAGAKKIGVDAFALLKAGEYLDSPEACKHYGLGVSSEFVAHVSSAVLTAAVSRFGEALASQLALWDKYWEAKGATRVQKPGAMSYMSTTRIRNDKKKGWSLEVSGSHVLQIVRAWGLPLQYRIEKTRRQKNVLQDVLLDLEKSGSSTRGVVTITVIFGDRNTRKICVRFNMLRKVVRPGQPLPPSELGTTTLVPGDVLPTRPPPQHQNPDRATTIVTADVGAAIAVGRTDVNMTTGVLKFSDPFCEVKKMMKPCLEHLDALGAKAAVLLSLSQNDKAGEWAAKVEASLKKELQQLDEAIAVAEGKAAVAQAVEAEGVDAETETLEDDEPTLGELQILRNKAQLKLDKLNAAVINREEMINRKIRQRFGGPAPEPEQAGSDMMEIEDDGEDDRSPMEIEDEGEDDAPQDDKPPPPSEKRKRRCRRKNRNRRDRKKKKREREAAAVAAAAAAAAAPAPVPATAQPAEQRGRAKARESGATRAARKSKAPTKKKTADDEAADADDEEEEVAFDDAAASGQKRNRRASSLKRPTKAAKAKVAVPKLTKEERRAKRKERRKQRKERRTIEREKHALECPTQQQRRQWAISALLRKAKKVCNQRRVKERKLTAMVKAEHKKHMADIAQNATLIIMSKATVLDWVKRRKGRNLNAATTRLLLRFNLCWMHDFFVQNMTFNYGVSLLSPHEAFTTNTCMVCHEYIKANIPPNRFRKCPDDRCHAYHFGIHRELIGGLNQIVAAECQVRRKLAEADQ